MIEPRWAIERWSRWVERPWRCADMAPGSFETLLGFADGSVQWIDAMGQEVWEAGWGAPVTQVRVLADKKKIAVLDEYSRLRFLDFKGNRLKTKKFKVYWTSFEVQSKALVLWGWRSPPRVLNFQGKKLRELSLPKPWRVVRAMRRKDLFFVVHNQVAVGVYDAKGTRRWSVNSPAPIDLSRATPADIVASDTGNLVAVGCFDKGVYLYNLLARTLRHIDLETRVDHLAVSGDGRWLLLADAVGGIRLVTAEATVVWEKRLASRVRFCRLDRKGQRALVLEESGRLSCLEFTDSQRPRAQFLELEEKGPAAAPRQEGAEMEPPGPEGGRSDFLEF